MGLRTEEGILALLSFDSERQYRNRFVIAS